MRDLTQPTPAVPERDGEETEPREIRVGMLRDVKHRSSATLRRLGYDGLADALNQAVESFIRAARPEGEDARRERALRTLYDAACDGDSLLAWRMDPHAFSFEDFVRAASTSPGASAMARSELRGATIRPGESDADFAKRLVGMLEASEREAKNAGTHRCSRCNTQNAYALHGASRWRACIRCSAVYKTCYFCQDEAGSDGYCDEHAD